MLACAEQRLDEVELSWCDDWAVSVVLTSAGYPGSYEKGKVITGIEDAEALDGVTVYHAGTREQDGQLSLIHICISTTSRTQSSAPARWLSCPTPFPWFLPAASATAARYPEPLGFDDDQRGRRTSAPNRSGRA